MATGQSWFTDESGMVKSTKLKPTESARFLRRAIKKWNGSNLTENDDETRCYLRHQAVEQCLKGLVTAQGRSFKHVHELNELWTAAESDAEPIRAPREGTATEVDHTMLVWWSGTLRHDLGLIDNALTVAPGSTYVGMPRICRGLDEED